QRRLGRLARQARRPAGPRRRRAGAVRRAPGLQPRARHARRRGPPAPRRPVRARRRRPRARGAGGARAAARPHERDVPRLPRPRRARGGLLAGHGAGVARAQARPLPLDAAGEAVGVHGHRQTRRPRRRGRGGAHRGRERGRRDRAARGPRRPGGGHRRAGTRPCRRPAAGRAGQGLRVAGAAPLAPPRRARGAPGEAGGDGAVRARLAGWLDVLGGASFALLPLVAPFLLGLRALLSGDRLSWAWLVPWAGMLAVGAVHAVAGHGPWLLVETAAAALACVALVPGSRRRLLAGLAVGLVAALAAALLERELTRSQWTPDPAEATVTDLVAGVSRVSGDRPTFRRNGLGLVEKRWSVPAGAESLELTFELRGLSGEPGWQWYTNSPRTRQERLEEDGAAFTRLTALDAYVVRRV